MVVALLLALVLLLTSCYPTHPQSTFDAAGPVSKNLLNLFWIIFWIAVVVFVVVVGLLVYSIVRFRERPGQKLPVQVHGNRRLEIAWTIVPALLLAAISVMTVQTLFELRTAPSEDPLRVEVIAHQWWWEVIYPDFNITTANEIVVPVSRDVTLKLDSVDVIHSFWVPKLAGKKDVIPNHTNTTWFRADEVGTFLGQCAEFCGIAHALMQIRVVAKTLDEFQEWTDIQRAAATIPTEGEALKGFQVFNSKGCLVCHSNTGMDTVQLREDRQRAFWDSGPEWVDPDLPHDHRVTEDSAKPHSHNITHAPNLTHFASRGTFAGAIKENNEGNLKEWLRNPEKMKPGNRMARLADAFNDREQELSEQDITALVAYLLSLK